MPNFSDSVSVTSQRVKTPEGFLRAPAYLGRTGVLVYAPGDPAHASILATAPAEVRDALANRPIRIGRLADDVFSPVALENIKGKPIADDHPSELIDSTNYKAHTVGAVGTDVMRDGDFVRGTVTIYDAKVVSEIDSGKSELSLGYEARIEWTPSDTYDAIQRDIRANHLAVTMRGRSGHDVRIFDADGEQCKMAKRTINGVEIEIAETVTGAVDAFIADSAKASEAARLADARVAELTGKIAALEAQVTERDAQIAKLSDAATLDARVKERAALIETAKRIDSAVVCDGLTDDAIRAAVVAAKGITVEGADAIRGAFAALAASAPAAPAATKFNDSAPVNRADYAKAAAEYRAAMSK